MTKSCWLLFSFLNEMVNTSFQEERLLISCRAVAISHSNLFRLPPLHPWTDKADHGVDRGFPSHVFIFTFPFYFFLLFLSQLLQNEICAIALGHAIPASTLETSGRSFWCSCWCLQYLWILDWKGHEKMAPVERFINGGDEAERWWAGLLGGSISDTLIVWPVNVIDRPRLEPD